MAGTNSHLKQPFFDPRCGGQENRKGFLGSGTSSTNAPPAQGGGVNCIAAATAAADAASATNSRVLGGVHTSESFIGTGAALSAYSAARGLSSQESAENENAATAATASAGTKAKAAVAPLWFSKLFQRVNDARFYFILRVHLGTGFWLPKGYAGLRFGCMFATYHGVKSKDRHHNLKVWQQDNLRKCWKHHPSIFVDVAQAYLKIKGLDLSALYLSPATTGCEQLLAELMSNASKLGIMNAAAEPVLPKQCMKVMCIGFPNQRQMRVTYGEILEVFDDGTVRHSCATFPGSSGALLFRVKCGSLVACHFKRVGKPCHKSAKPMKSNGMAVSLAVAIKELNAMTYARINNQLLCCNKVFNSVFRLLSAPAPGNENLEQEAADPEHDNFCLDLKEKLQGVRPVRCVELGTSASCPNSEVSFQTSGVDQNVRRVHGCGQMDFAKAVYDAASLSVLEESCLLHSTLQSREVAGLLGFLCAKLQQICEEQKVASNSCKPCVEVDVGTVSICKNEGLEVQRAYAVSCTVSNRQWVAFMDSSNAPRVV